MNDEVWRLVCLSLQRFLVALPPYIAIRFVDRLEERTEARRLIHRPDTFQTISESVEVALRQQSYGNYTFAVHACCPVSIC